MTKSKPFRKMIVALLGAILTTSGGVAINRVQGKWWLELLYFAAAVAFLSIATAAFATGRSDSPSSKANRRKVRKARSKLVRTVLPSRYSQLVTDISPKTVRHISLEVRATYAPLRSCIRGLPKGQDDLLETSNIELAYKRSGGSLLVLGQAGAGKTYAVASLVNRLAVLARSNPVDPLPFYLDLSDWDGNRSDFQQWCISTISKEYGPKEEHVSIWLNEEDLVLIFDGLDQLPRKLRTGCVAAINSLRQGHGLLSLVVTCRGQEYFDTSRRLQLSGCL